ncbi:hypothetical protein ACFLT9_14240 [Acidobacteriota bacterium]
MKKTAVMIVLILVICVSFTTAEAFHKNDLQIIKKAVKKNPSYSPGHEVRYFKVLIRDTRRNKVRLKVTLPIALVEILSECQENLDIDCDYDNVDFKKLFKQLKKIGPMSLIELHGDDALIKIWLE